MSRSSDPRGLSLRHLHLGAVACLVSLSCIFAPAAFGQRVAAQRGAAVDGGYGAAGSIPGDTRGAAGSTKTEIEFPAARTSAAAGPIAEYQKPTYTHHRFAVSPDGRRMALSGSHVEKEPSSAPDQPAKAKRDAGGKPIVRGHVLEVIDVPTGRALAAFKPPQLFENMALSADSRFFAAESPDRPGIVLVMHLPTRKSKELNTELRRIVPGGLAFSPDNRSLFAIAPDRMKTITLANGESSELKYEFASPAAAYSPPLGVLAVSVSRSRQGKPEVQIYDVATGKQTRQLAVPAFATYLQFSPDGKYLAATVSGGAVGIWQSGEWTPVGSSAARLPGEPGQLAISPDAQTVAVRPRTPGRDLARVINIASGETVHSIASRDVFFLPSGELAVSGVNGPYYLNVSSGTLTEVPEAAVGDASFAATGQGGGGYGADSGPSSDTSPQGAQGGYGAYVPQPATTQPGYGQYPDQQTGAQAGYGAPPSPQPQAGYGAYGAPPTSPQSDYGAPPSQPTSEPGYGAPPSQASSSNAGYGAYGAPPTNTSGYGTDGPPSGSAPAYGAVNAPSSNASAYGTDAPGLGTIASDTMSPITQDFEAKSTGVHTLGASADGTRLVTAKVEPAGESYTSRLAVWDLTSGQQLHELEATGNCVSFAFSADLDYLAASIFEQNPEADARVWHLPSGKETAFARSDEPAIGKVTFSADGKSVVTLHYGYVKYNPLGSERQPQVQFARRHAKFAYWPERNELAAADLGATPTQRFSNLYVYALPSISAQRRLRLPAVTSMAYSPDGKHLAVGQEGGQIIVYDTAGWTETAKIDGGQAPGYAGIAVSKGGKYVTATLRETGNRTLLVWRSDTNQALPSLSARVHEFLANGLLVTSPGADGGVKFYDLDNNRQVWPWEKPGQGGQSAAAAAGYGGYPGTGSGPQTPAASSYGR